MYPDYGRLSALSILRLWFYGGAKCFLILSIQSKPVRLDGQKNRRTTITGEDTIDRTIIVLFVVFYRASSFLVSLSHKTLVCLIAFTARHISLQIQASFFLLSCLGVPHCLRPRRRQLAFNSRIMVSKPFFLKILVWRQFFSEQGVYEDKKEHLKISFLAKNWTPALSKVAVVICIHNREWWV